MQLNACQLRLRNLRGDLKDPASASAADVAGFRQQQWPLITLPDLLQHPMQRQASAVAQMPVKPPV